MRHATQALLPMAAALPLKVRAARYAVEGDAGLADAVQSDTVTRAEC